MSRALFVVAITAMGPGCGVIGGPWTSVRSSAPAGASSGETSRSQGDEADQASQGPAQPSEPVGAGRVAIFSAPVDPGAPDAATPIDSVRMSADAHPTLFVDQPLNEVAARSGLDVGFGASQGINIEVLLPGASPLRVRQTFTVPVFERATVIPLTIAGLGGRDPLVWPTVGRGELQLAAAIRELPDGSHPITVRVFLQTRPATEAFGPMAPTPAGPEVRIAEGRFTLTVDAAARAAFARSVGPTLAPNAFANRRELAALERAARATYGSALVRVRGYFDGWRVETDRAGRPTRRTTVLTVVTRDSSTCIVRGVGVTEHYRQAGSFGDAELRDSNDPRLGRQTIPCDSAR